MGAFGIDLEANPPTTARRECCLCSAALLLCSAALLLNLSTVDVVVLLGATAQKPPEPGHAGYPAYPAHHLPGQQYEAFCFNLLRSAA